MSGRAVTRSYVDLPTGQVHVARAGRRGAPAVLLLHQTPRSWREYAAVLPLLADHVDAVAMDTPGFGASDPLPGPATIEGWAAAAAGVLDALTGPACVVGHHTGGVVALQLAAARPDLVERLVLSSTPLTDAAFRAARATSPAIDHVERSADGAHLQALWDRRAAFYPVGRPDLLEAFTLDALASLDRAEDGHRAVAAYEVERRIGAVRAPALVVRATADPFAAPHADDLAAALGGAPVVEVEGGMVPLPDQLPERFAEVVLSWVGGPVAA